MEVPCVELSLSNNIIESRSNKLTDVKESRGKNEI